MEECAAISRCFIMDLSATIQSLVDDGDVTGYAVYTPYGSEEQLRQLLPQGFKLVLQAEGTFGTRLLRGASDLLDAGHDGAILINSDSPTLPKTILRQAVDAVRAGDNVTLSPAFDGGYTLIGLSKLYAQLFADIPWSTDEVYRLTLERARAIGLNVVNVPSWYDVDDAASLRMLEEEMTSGCPSFASAGTVGADAPMTRRFLRERERKLACSA